MFHCLVLPNSLLALSINIHVVLSVQSTFISFVILGLMFRFHRGNWQSI